MGKTPLCDKLVGMGVRSGEYCGFQTALAFGDPRTEFASLVRGCGLYDLGWRVQFRISGQDRVRWLNGMVTNNVRDLPAGRGNYNFVLTAQGRIQGDLYIYNRGEEFVAVTEQTQLETLLKVLRKYIIMDRVELTDLSNQVTAVGVQGLQARTVLGKAGLAEHLPGAMELADIDWQQLSYE